MNFTPISKVQRQTKAVFNSSKWYSIILNSSNIAWAVLGKDVTELLIENNVFEDIDDIDLLLSKDAMQAVIEAEVAKKTWDFSNYKTMDEIWK